MTNANPQDMITQLEELLDQERHALLTGQLVEVARIGDAKAMLIDTLGDAVTTNGEDLKELKEKIARNQVLFDGALQGIRKVATRLAALRRIRRSLETYDADGQKRDIQGDVQRKMEKRA